MATVYSVIIAGRTRCRQGQTSLLDRIVMRAKQSFWTGIVRAKQGFWTGIVRAKQGFWTGIVRAKQGFWTG